MKTLTSMLRNVTIALLLFISSLHSNGQFFNPDFDIPILWPDLDVTNVSIINYQTNQFRFRYTIQNNGQFGTLNLERFFFQVWLSKDTQLDSEDIPGGGSNFGNLPVPLEIGETYTGTWTTYPSYHPSEEYRYMIFDVKLRQGMYQPEETTANNRLVKDLRPHFPDLLMQSITITEVDSNNRIKFNYKIINNGSSDLHLEKFLFDVSVSSRIFDVPAGSSRITTTPIALSPGETFTGSYTAAPTQRVDLSNYYTLKFKVRTMAAFFEPQKYLSNDQFHKNMLNDFADLQVQILSNTVLNRTVSITYRVDNKGKNDLYLHRHTSYVYLSEDIYLSGGDIEITQFEISAAPLTLGPNNYYTGRFTFVVPPGIDLSVMKYAVLAVVADHDKLQAEKTNDNNFGTQLLNIISTSKTSFTLQQNTSIVQLENKSDGQSLTEYILYSTEGRVIKQGSIIKETELSTKGLKTGLYILQLHSGETKESHKVIVQE